MRLQHYFIFHFMVLIDINLTTGECIGRASGVRHVCDLDDLTHFDNNPYNRTLFMVVRKQATLRSLRKTDLETNGKYFLEFIVESALNGIENDALDYLTSVNMIMFTKNNFNAIKRNTFKNLKLRTLLLSDNNVKAIQEEAFVNLSKIEKIDLSNNQITVINVDVFNNLKLNYLDLSNNHLMFIEDGAFFNMKYLKKLYLGGNWLRNFESGSLLNCTKFLTILQLEDNLLTYLGPENFENLSDLKHLDLQDNIIVSMAAGTFSSVQKLKKLWLSHNRLMELNVDIFLGYAPNISHLFIDHNYLTYLSTEFLEVIQKPLKSFNMFGNPWKCSCLQIILEWIHVHNINLGSQFYFNSSRPVCIVDENNLDCNPTCDDKLKKKYIKQILPYN